MHTKKREEFWQKMYITINAPSCMEMKFIMSLRNIWGRHLGKRANSGNGVRRRNYKMSVTFSQFSSAKKVHGECVVDQRSIITIKNRKNTLNLHNHPSFFPKKNFHSLRQGSLNQKGYKNRFLFLNVGPFFLSDTFFFDILFRIRIK